MIKGTRANRPASPSSHPSLELCVFKICTRRAFNQIARRRTSSGNVSRRNTNGKTGTPTSPALWRITLFGEATKATSCPLFWKPTNSVSVRCSCPPHPSEASEWTRRQIGASLRCGKCAVNGMGSCVRECRRSKHPRQELANPREPRCYPPKDCPSPFTPSL